MGAAEDRENEDGTALVDRRELQAARKLAVRLLEMIGKLESQPPVDVDSTPAVRTPSTQPTAEDFAELRARRRRKAHRHG